MFNSYVELPEGTDSIFFYVPWQRKEMEMTKACVKTQDTWLVDWTGRTRRDAGDATHHEGVADGATSWRSTSTTVDGQNIQTLKHALCWTPAPPNLNVSARVLPKVMLGVWFVSSIRANALQVTLTLNLGGRGVVPDRRALNISFIYGRSVHRPGSWPCRSSVNGGFSGKECLIRLYPPIQPTVPMQGKQTIYRYWIN